MPMSCRKLRHDLIIKMLTFQQDGDYRVKTVQGFFVTNHISCFASLLTINFTSSH